MYILALKMNPDFSVIFSNRDDFKLFVLNSLSLLVEMKSTAFKTVFDVLPITY
jgi:hypothetical protein